MVFGIYLSLKLKAKIKGRFASGKQTPTINFIALFELEDTIYLLSCSFVFSHQLCTVW